MKQANKNYLKKYEKDLNNAVNSNFCRSLPRSVVQRIEEIYFDETGKSLNTNFGCGSCVLSLLKKVGILYGTIENKGD